MSNGMRVDLSALDDVIRKLNGLLSNMDSANEKAKYETDIPSTAFGHLEFQESNALHRAHAAEKARIEKIIKGLHELIDDFGKSASKVKDKYTEQEHAEKARYNQGAPEGAAN